MNRGTRTLPQPAILHILGEWDAEIIQLLRAESTAHRWCST